MGFVGGHDAGDAEIEDAGAPVFVADQVLGLDVEVHHAGAVCERQAGAGVVDQPEQLAPRRRLRLADERRQRLARHVLHGDERPPVVLADVEDGDDVRVVETAGGARLAGEALAGGGVERVREHLHGDVTADQRIAGQIDLAHAAAAEQADGLEAADVVELAHRGPMGSPGAGRSRGRNREL